MINPFVMVFTAKTDKTDNTHTKEALSASFIKFSTNNRITKFVAVKCRTVL